MPATRKSPRATNVASTEPHDEIIGIIAAALTRLIQTDRAPVIQRPDTSTGVSAGNLSESVEIGLELSRETRLSVAG